VIGLAERVPLDPDVREDPAGLVAGEVLFPHRDHDDGAYGSCTGDLVVTSVYGRVAEFQCDAPGCRHAGSMLLGSVARVRARAAEYRARIDGRFDR
jgi:hypothetical protein